MTTYSDFLKTKQRNWAGVGVTPPAHFDGLFDWQQAITRWAVKKGRAAIFADTGLGKTRMQAAWAAAIGKRTLIFAPLCVGEQTVKEAAKIGVPIQYAADQAESDRNGTISITNYERQDKFDPAKYGAVVLDESGILKSFDGKTRTRLIASFQNTPYRLCCTATPSPNDISELANHSEFLGLMTRAEFLATWFVHDDTGWRMKRHAVGPFYRWLASWAMAIRKPSDLGYPDDGFNLPALNIHDVILKQGRPVNGALFHGFIPDGIRGRLRARASSVEARVKAAADLVDGAAQWLVWCGLNEESSALARAIPGATEVRGDMSYADKAAAIHGFVDGSVRVLVTKPKIAGWGLNFQHCHKVAFVGLSDSYEAYYQSIRRVWRFGQKKPVDVYIIISEGERVIVDNVRNKERAAAQLSQNLSDHIHKFEIQEVSHVAQD